jgi:hypothetical protein
VPERRRESVTNLLSPEADVLDHVVAELAHPCRERVRSRHSRMAETIRPIADSGAVILASA